MSDQVRDRPSTHRNPSTDNNRQTNTDRSGAPSDRGGTQDGSTGTRVNAGSSFSASQQTSNAANPSTPAGTRPEGWISVSQSPLSGDQLRTVDGVPQPVESGWYVVSADVVAGANHTSIAYYDAAAQAWSNSTAIQGGQSVPGVQTDLATNPTNQFFPISMGPAATAALGTGPAAQSAFNAMMADDLQQLSSGYASLGVNYHPLAMLTSAFDGNCNTYTAFVLNSLGGNLSGSLLEFPGSSLVGRDGDAVYIDTRSRGALGSRDRHVLTMNPSLSESAK